MSPQKSLAELLGRGPLRTYTKRIQESDRLVGIIRACVDTKTGLHIVGAKRYGSTLIVEVDSSAWAAKVQLSSTQILAKLLELNDFESISYIRARTR